MVLEEKYICDGFDHCDNHDDTDEDEGDIDDSEDSSFFSGIRSSCNCS